MKARGLRKWSAVLTGEVPGLRVAGSAQDLVDACDFVWLTVADDAIGPVASALRWRRSSIPSTN